MAQLKSDYIDLSSIFRPGSSFNWRFNTFYDSYEKPLGIKLIRSLLEVD
jgi:hypothetical protein